MWKRLWFCETECVMCSFVLCITNSNSIRFRDYYNIFTFTCEYVRIYTSSRQWNIVCHGGHPLPFYSDMRLFLKYFNHYKILCPSSCSTVSRPTIFLCMRLQFVLIFCRRNLYFLFSSDLHENNTGTYWVACFMCFIRTYNWLHTWQLWIHGHWQLSTPEVLEQQKV